MFPSYPDIDEEKLEKLIQCCELQHVKIYEQREVIVEQGRKLARVEMELAEALDQLRVEGALRPSIEVLQRMANGLDPFDKGRFQCAVAALPHETPKLSASVNVYRGPSIGDRMDRASGKFTVIEGGPDAA